MIGNEYLRVVGERFRLMKKSAEEAMKQVSDSALFLNNGDSNSIAVIVNHLCGNMVSRWTDFLTTDGEKPYRNRSNEFVHHFSGRQEMMKYWEIGWSQLFNTLDHLKSEDLLKVVTIRNEPLSVIEAIERQMHHYAYHVGQIVYICKHFAVEKWNNVYA